MIAFAQGWNVEQEVPEEEARRRGSKTVARGPGGRRSLNQRGARQYGGWDSNPHVPKDNAF